MVTDLDRKAIFARPVNHQPDGSHYGEPASRRWRNAGAISRRKTWRPRGSSPSGGPHASRTGETVAPYSGP